MTITLDATYPPAGADVSECTPITEQQLTILSRMWWPSRLIEGEYTYVRISSVGRGFAVVMENGPGLLMSGYFVTGPATPDWLTRKAEEMLAYYERDQEQEKELCSPSH